MAVSRNTTPGRGNHKSSIFSKLAKPLVFSAMKARAFALTASLSTIIGSSSTRAITAARKIPERSATHVMTRGLFIDRKK
ncbi:MAG: hypothetical protein ACXW6T_11905 [Candidatus Binatia bacterium]